MRNEKQKKKTKRRTFGKVTGRLVVVRKRNNRGANAQHDGRVDFHVRVRRFGAREYLGFHRDHDSLLLSSVYVLYEASLDEVGPPHLAPFQGHGVFVLKTRLAPRRLVPLVHALIQAFDRVDDEERPAAAARLGAYANLLLHDIAADRDFVQRLHNLPAHEQQLVNEVLRAAVKANPVAVYEHLRGHGNISGRDYFEGLGTKLLEELEDVARGRANRHVAHKRKVLDEAARLSFRRLGRAHVAPVRVVQLPRLCHFALASERRVEASQVREGRRIRESVQNLRDARLGRCSALLEAPVSRRERVLQAVSDDSVLNGCRQIKVLILIRASLEARLHVFDESLEEDAEQVRH